MPGYLTNRRISFLPATVAEIEAVQSSIAATNIRVTEAEANIDDLSLNIGV
jgi:hypothetical protein